MATSKWTRLKSRFWDLVAWTSKPPEPGTADREPIWSIPRPFRHTYFVILSLIWWPNCVIKAAEHQASWIGEPFWLMPAKAFEAFGAELVGIGIAGAIATLILVQGASYPMVIYQSLVNRFVTPVIDRHIATGRAQGRAEGAQAQDELWRDWLRRKQEAEAQGLEFNEPPPGTDNPKRE